MVNILSGSVSAYRQESANQRFIRIDEVMDLINVTRDEAMDIALAAGARYQLAKITLVHKERLMKYMKHFTRVPSSNKIVEKKFVRIGEGSMTYACLAYGSITLDGDFVVSGIRIVESKEGRPFVSYPSRKNQSGEYKNICFPMKKALREDIEVKVLSEYEKL